MREGNSFSLSRLAGEGGYPISGLDWGGGTSSQVQTGGTPSQVWTGGGTSSQVQTGGTPYQVWTWGGTSSQVQMGGTPFCWLGGTPPSKTGWGTPWPDLGQGSTSPSKTGWGTPLARAGTGVPPVQNWMGEYPPPSQTWDGGGYQLCPRLDGYPPPPQSKTGWGKTPPPHHQQSEHLLRGGRCASCVHAGELSCFKKFYLQSYWNFCLISNIWWNKVK